MDIVLLDNTPQNIITKEQFIKLLAPCSDRAPVVVRLLKAEGGELHLPVEAVASVTNWGPASDQLAVAILARVPKPGERGLFESRSEEEILAERLKFDEDALNARLERDAALEKERKESEQKQAADSHKQADAAPALTPSVGSSGVPQTL